MVIGVDYKHLIMRSGNYWSKVRSNIFCFLVLQCGRLVNSADALVVREQNIIIHVNQFLFLERDQTGKSLIAYPYERQRKVRIRGLDITYYYHDSNIIISD